MTSYFVIRKYSDSLGKVVKMLFCSKISWMKGPSQSSLCRKLSLFLWNFKIFLFFYYFFFRGLYKWDYYRLMGRNQKYCISKSGLVEAGLMTLVFGKRAGFLRESDCRGVLWNLSSSSSCAAAGKYVLFVKEFFWSLSKKMPCSAKWTFLADIFRTKHFSRFSPALEAALPSHKALNADACCGLTLICPVSPALGLNFSAGWFLTGGLVWLRCWLGFEPRGQSQGCGSCL